MDVICESCGSMNRSAGEFCTECGAFLAWDPHSSTRPAEAGTGVDSDRQAGDHQPGREQPTTSNSAPQGTGPEPTTTETTQATTAVLPTPPEGPVCPTCSLVNEPGRRFCAKCGTQLVATPTPQTRYGDNAAELRRRERADERAFSESLPAIYRWRRVGLIAVAVGLVAALAITVGANPIGWAKARWYDVRGTVVEVQGVQATVVPAGGQAGKPGSSGDPALLVDGTTADWHTRWTSTEPAVACEGGPATPTIELALAQPVRIRAIDIYPGLAADQPQRALQFRPQTVGITPVGVGACTRMALADSADRQRLAFDSRKPVSVIRISIDSAYPGPADAQKRLSIREIQLLSRPQ
jgi:hypothetical protein